MDARCVCVGSHTFAIYILHEHLAAALIFVVAAASVTATSKLISTIASYDSMQPQPRTSMFIMN